MWPLYLSQLVDAAKVGSISGTTTGEPLEAEIAQSAIHRAIAWSGVTLGANDSFFAVETSLHSLVPDALAHGVVCVVDKTWSGLAELDPAVRARCFVAADHPLLAYRRLAAFMRPRFDFPVIAVGGSNGKTTTKDMIVHILASSAAAAGRERRLVTSTPGTNNGWVGIPITLCQPAHAVENRPYACILEIGIDEKGAMREHVALAAPDIAVLTALGPEHLAGLGTHEDAIREELELFAGSKQRVWLAEDPALAARLAEVRAGDLIVRRADESTSTTLPEISTLTYSWRAATMREGIVAVSWKGVTREASVPMPGEHNGRNAALAIGVALLAGASLDHVVTALGTFRGPEQRCVVQELPSGCILIDDSYNASPGSIDAALDVIAGFDPKRERLIVLGDMLDLGDEAARWHQAIVPKLASLRGAHIRLFGEQMSALAPLLRDAASVGRAAKSSSEDPTLLIDVGNAALEQCIVLVKGSRGMALERVVAHIAKLGARNRDDHDDDDDDPRIGVGVVGVGAEDLARALRAAFREGEGARKGFDRVFVRALDQTMLEGGEVLRRPYHVAVIANKLELGRHGGGGDNNGDNDLERELAAIAQLFMHVRSVAILPSKSDAGPAENHEEEEEMQLLAGVVPLHARTKRAPREVITALTIDSISELISRAQS